MTLAVALELLSLGIVIHNRAFHLLGPNARFTDARAATLQAATDLYGSSSNERAQVLAAWNAVGVN